MGHMRTKKRNKASALRKPIGRTATFTECPPKTSRDIVMGIQMSTQFWESGVPSPSQIKFLAGLSELKKVIHQGARVNELPARFWKMCLKCPILMQSCIDDAKAISVEDRKSTRVCGPNITIIANGKTTCATMKSRRPSFSILSPSNDNESPTDSECDINDDTNKHFSTCNAPSEIVCEAHKKGIDHQPTSHKLHVALTNKPSDSPVSTHRNTQKQMMTHKSNSLPEFSSLGCRMGLIDCLFEGLHLDSVGFEI